MAQLKNLIVNGASRFLGPIKGDLSGTSDYALKLETYKQGSSTETYKTSYPLWAQWESGSVLKLLCTGYSTKVDIANQLATPRTVKTNLGTTSAASFDGTANITPGVSGTLPVSNGGTGATSLTSDFALIGKGTSAISSSNLKISNYEASLTASTSAETRYIATNSLGSVSLWASTNRGVYDQTSGKWIIASKSDGTKTYVPRWANKGGATSPIYFDSDGSPEVCSWIANRLVWTSNTTTLTGANHYADDSHIGVNMTSVPPTALGVGGNITAYTSGAYERNVFAQNSVGKISLIVTASGNRGLYDSTKGSYLLYYNATNDRNQQNTTYFTGTPYLINSAYTPSMYFQSSTSDDNKPMGRIRFLMQENEADTKYTWSSFYFYQYSYAANTRGRVEFYERYKLPTTAAGLTASATYNILTTKTTTSVGGTAKPVYFNSAGNPVACSSTVGGTATPVYMNSGTITKCSSTVGSGTKPVYMSSGTITASSSTVGTSTTPVYMSSGTLTACSRAIPIVYTASECTSYTSDSGTCTPAAVKKAVTLFGDDRYVRLTTDQTISDNKTFKATTYFANAMPLEAGSGSVGTLTSPWEYFAAKYVRACDGTNDNYYCYMRPYTIGTSSTIGNGRLTLGNSIAEGTAGNARGSLVIYSGGTQYCIITGYAGYIAFTFG